MLFRSFLRTFGLESLDELPEINKMQFGKPKLPEEEQPAEEHEEGTEHGKEAE